MYKMMPPMPIETVTTSTLTFTIYSLSSLLTMLYNVPNNVTVTYNLYTPENKAGPIAFKNYSDVTISNKNRELKVLCHGWNTYDNHSLDWYSYVIKDYMKSGNFNVITVHYDNVLKPVTWTKMMPYSKPIGEQVGNMLVHLYRKSGVQLSKVHVIGHGLGAHVAGVSGEVVFEQTGKQMDRITGLDPASYGLQTYQEDNRLSAHDASFVDTIYTTYYGSQHAIGKVDFYANTYNNKCSYKIRQLGLAPAIFAKTINKEKKLVGVKCLNVKYYYFRQKCPSNTTAEAGEHVDRNTFGKYYINTTAIFGEICSSTKIVG